MPSEYALRGFWRIAPIAKNEEASLAKQHLEDVVKPLRDKAETIFVVPGSNTKEYVPRHFTHKKTKQGANGLAGQDSIRGFMRGLPFVFRRRRSQGLNTTYHCAFTGQEELKATVVICDKTFEVSEGHMCAADLRMTADSQTWLPFLRKEANLV